MDKNQIEIFGELTYSEHLTYEELLDRERVLLEQLDGIFLDAGAAHLDFTPHGDLLMLQCAFEYRNLEIMRDIAQEVAAVLPDGIRGRIFCLEKNLAYGHMFWVAPLQWQEREFELPFRAPEGTPVNKITRVKPQEVPGAEVVPVPAPAPLLAAPAVQTDRAVASRCVASHESAGDKDS